MQIQHNTGSSRTLNMSSNLHIFQIPKELCIQFMCTMVHKNHGSVHIWGLKSQVGAFSVYFNKKKKNNTNVHITFLSTLIRIKPKTIFP